jgi:hypothetical protein
MLSFLRFLLRIRFSIRHRNTPIFYLGLQTIYAPDYVNSSLEWPLQILITTVHVRRK